MGRNMDETKKEYRWFVDNGVQLRFVKEPMINTKSHDDVIQKAIQDIILTLLTSFAEKERDEIKTRQAEGIAVAKKNGIKFGRPAVAFPKEWEKYYKQWKDNEITAVQSMESLGMAKATFYRKVKEYENIE